MDGRYPSLKWLGKMIEEIREGFSATFGTEPEVISFAPGRVNIIGEHTDYNGGLVLPAAIRYGTYVAVSRAADGKIEVYSENAGWERWDAGVFERRGNFGDYLRGVLKFMEAPAEGLRAYIKSSLPVGSGLSSSAALEVSFALAIQKIFSLDISGIEIVRVCHRAESEFVGVRCGIMDQFVSFFAKKEHLILLDTQSLHHEYIPFPSSLTLAMVDTGIRRSLSSSRYNQRREECRRALEAVKKLFPDVENLSQVNEEMLLSTRPLMDEASFKRAMHVISENQRVSLLADFLRAGDLCMVEKIMKLAHQSLSEDFEVSLPDIDDLVEKISSLPFVYGARLTGAGFGGFLIVLLLKGREKELQRSINQPLLFSRPWSGAELLYSVP